MGDRREQKARRGKRVKRIFLLVAIVGLVLSMATSASAHTGRGARLRLFDDGTGAEIGWVNGEDSPLDDNTSALSIRTDANEYAYAFNPTWLGKPFDGNTIAGTTIRNLSFDFENAAGGGYEGAGAPRLSIAIDENGDGTFDCCGTGSTEQFAFLAGFHCDQPLVENPKWSRADFTGRVTLGCALQYKGPDYASTGTQSAWQTFIDAFPNARVDYGFLIVDEQTSPGRALVDRIAMLNHMQTARRIVVHCPSEGSC